MQTYLFQLHNDLENAILHRWNVCPPHYFEMGIPDRWLNPPVGYAGPPLGFGHEEDEVIKNSYLSILEFEKTIAEVESYVEEKPKINMFDHFGFEPEQFPPAEKLSDEHLDTLTTLLCRLWAAYNFTPVFPQKTPGRVMYPLLQDRMAEPAMLVTYGHIGVEFCHYEPSECPFGSEWCDCKDF